MKMSRQGGQLCINCNIKVQRLNLPERENIAGSAHAYEVFSGSDPMTQRLEFSREQKKLMGWVDLGDDPKLAAEILNRFEKRMRKGL